MARNGAELRTIVIVPANSQNPRTIRALPRGIRVPRIPRPGLKAARRGIVGGLTREQYSQCLGPNSQPARRSLTLRWSRDPHSRSRDPNIYTIGHCYRARPVRHDQTLSAVVDCSIQAVVAVADASTLTNLDCPKIKELYDLRRKVKEWTRGEGDSMDTTDKES